MNEDNDKVLVGIIIRNWKTSEKPPSVYICEYCTPICARDAKGWNNWGMSAVMEIIKK